MLESTCCGAPPKEGWSVEKDSIVGADLDEIKFRAGYQTLWDTIHSKDGFGWNANPFCWVIEFKRIATPQPEGGE